MPGLQGLEFWSHIPHEELDLARGWHWTHEQMREAQKRPRVLKRRFEKASVAKVRRGPGFPVSNFRELVRCIAELGSCNTRFNLFFRGQNDDYLDKKGKTKLYPTIFRPDTGRKQLRKPVIKSRFAVLRSNAAKIRAKRAALELSSHLSVHPEYWYSFLQHYGICLTPLLDLTQSLRVAATFALHDTGTWVRRTTGYLYVLGMPHLHGCISAFVDDRIILVKLQNVCPPRAQRPHFQEAYLVGGWPRTLLKEANDNFAYWLVGKYLLDNTRGNFFGDDFPPIPRKVLLPSEDPFQQLLLELVVQGG